MEQKKKAKDDDGSKCNLGGNSELLHLIRKHLMKRIKILKIELTKKIKNIK